MTARWTLVVGVLEVDVGVLVARILDVVDRHGLVLVTRDRRTVLLAGAALGAVVATSTPAGLLGAADSELLASPALAGGTTKVQAAEACGTEGSLAVVDTILLRLCALIARVGAGRVLLAFTPITLPST